MNSIEVTSPEWFDHVDPGDPSLWPTPPFAAEIVGRKLFSHSFPGTDDIGGYVLAIIAVIGASTEPNKVGGMPIRLLRQHGYPGAVRGGGCDFGRNANSCLSAASSLIGFARDSS